MKLFKVTAASVSLAAALALGACASDDEGNGGTETTTEATTSTDAVAPDLPSAADLNAVMATATDPEAPVEEKVNTVQGAETAPELFDTMTQAKAESGADFQVVDPVLPGYTQTSVLTTVMFSLPDREAQPADNVEFVYEDGHWKLAQQWACTLITNTVPSEEVPEMCADQVGANDLAPIEEGAPEAEEGIVEEAPAQ